MARDQDVDVLGYKRLNVAFQDFEICFGMNVSCLDYHLEELVTIITQWFGMRLGSESLRFGSA